MPVLTHLLTLTQLTCQTEPSEDFLAGPPIEFVTQDGVYFLTADGVYFGTPE